MDQSNNTVNEHKWEGPKPLNYGTPYALDGWTCKSCGMGWESQIGLPPDSVPLKPAENPEWYEMPSCTPKGVIDV